MQPSCLVHTVRSTCFLFVRQGTKVSLGLMRQGRLYLLTWLSCLCTLHQVSSSSGSFKSVPILGIHTHTSSALTGMLCGICPPPPPRDALTWGRPPSPPKLYPGVLRHNLHHATLWVLFWMVMMPPALMHHHPMYRA